MPQSPFATAGSAAGQRAFAWSSAPTSSPSIFTAAFAEENVAVAAASLRVPTLLFSGGLSPYLTQRIVQRLGAIIDGAEVRHLPAAGHMLPLTHASAVFPVIARHIARADELTGVPLALEAAPAEAVSLAEG